MNPQFVVVGAKMSQIVRDRLTNYLLTRKDLQWCHYLDDCWLVGYVPQLWITPRATAMQLHAQLQPIVPEAWLLVIEVPAGATYFGQASQPLWDWMKTHWDGRVQ